MGFDPFPAREVRVGSIHVKEQGSTEEGLRVCEKTDLGQLLNRRIVVLIGQALKEHAFR